jgi:putative hemolysin
LLREAVRETVIRASLACHRADLTSIGSLSWSGNMLQPGHGQSEKQHKLNVHLARAYSEIREAQRLRYRVFAEEMGARLSGGEDRIDEDLFDPYCDHLVVTDEETGDVLGTYRILSGLTAKRLGGFYSDQEFDLTRLSHLRERAVELGRSCVHPDHRSGAVIALLWSGLAQYMRQHGYEYIIGCASMSMIDGGHSAASGYARLAEKHMSPPEYRVFPRYPLPLHELDRSATPAIPPLIKAYLRVGAWVCGEPAWDPDFNTADLLMMLSLSRVDERYVKHFMRNAA